MYALGFQARNHPQQVRKNGGVDATVDDRGTRPEVFDPLQAEFNFTLDVAASDLNRKCVRYFTREQDGLAQSWHGARVWCNPPFSNLAAWAAKAVQETVGGGCPLVVMLLPNNRCEQIWWQKHVEPYRDCGMGVSVRFLPGRPRFVIPANVTTPLKGDRPPFGLCVVVFEAPKIALDIFGDLV